MENFEIGRKHTALQKEAKKQETEKNPETGKDTLNMSVSPICQKDGKKVAYVSFSDGRREAEGEIPSCKIIRNKGFETDEVEQLENYLKKELSSLKSMAAKINVFDAFLGRKP